MRHLLGLHWLMFHRDQWDFPHIEAMQYNSIKPFGDLWRDRDASANTLAALPQDAIILARDHPLSEQKQDMWDDPQGTGIRHADEWAQKVKEGLYHFPVDRTYFLGINEPDATHGDRNAIDIYTASFLNRLTYHGMFGGAFNFSTGHPRTVDGTPHTPADYSVFERSHEAIVEGNHIGVLHIYGTGAVPAAPGHYDRLRDCPWQDIQWVVGEFAIDEHVIGGGEHVGFHQFYEGRLHEYCQWLDNLIIAVNDPRIISFQVFTYDFSHPWSSFDTKPIRDALQNYNWQHLTRIVKNKVYIPGISKENPPVTTVVSPVSAVPPLLHPVTDPQYRRITQIFGVNQDYYSQFIVGGVRLKGHNGVDFGTPTGTKIVAVYSGDVVEVWNDPDGYGLYVKLRHFWGESLYAHLNSQSVTVGQQVSMGQEIGKSGNTGKSSGPHLHFGMRVNPYNRSDGWGGYVDPLLYLKQETPVVVQPVEDVTKRNALVVAVLNQVAAESRISYQLLASLAWAESSFRPNEGDGLFQIGDATWSDWAERVGARDRNNPLDNARVAAAYLNWLLDRYEEDLWKALYAFNWGPGRVDSGAEPPELTKTYANKVIHGRDLLKAVGA